MAHVSKHERHGAARRKFIRSAVLGTGFLSGLWVHLGFSPGNMVSAFLEGIVLNVDPVHVFWIKLTFVLIPIVLTVVAVVGIYRTAGWWGLLATVLAYLSGLWLNVYSIFLMAGAILLAIMSVKR